MLSRRQFVISAGCGLLLAGCRCRVRMPPPPTTGVRKPWSAFKNTASHQGFMSAITTMRANTNASDPNSWLYWANVHQNFCPHGMPYFLAWHRGYILLFESKLREISGDQSIFLPYWDYFTDPAIPAEFSDNSAGNPLYHDRVNTNVAASLTLAPFQNSVTNFQRGTANAFEPSIESLPHNQVHNLIGDIMASFQSPQDPIFWLHHANIDRLWAAWVRADAGRQMPPTTDAYWAGQFSYASAVTLDRTKTFDTQGIGYTYQDETMPSALPPPPPPPRPAIRSLPAIPKRSLGAAQLALGGARGLTLDERSVSVPIPLAKPEKERLTEALKAAPPAGAAAPTVRVVLDQIALTEAGRRGGYFYKVYVDLPVKSAVGERDEDYLIGTVGPFEIEAARQHATHAGAGTGAGTATLAFPVTDAMKSRLAKTKDLIVSFVRVSGSRSTPGEVISVGELRLDVGPEPVH